MAESTTDSSDVPPKMEEMLGLLRIHVKRGINLAVRDVRSSDPYVVVKMGKQTVYDHDTWSPDDPMGDAEIDILPYIEALKVDVADLPDGTIITRIHPGRQNCLAEESCIVCSDGKVIQDMALRLRNVESGEVELQLQWIELPGSRGPLK